MSLSKQEELEIRNSAFLGGFDFCGYRQPDGKIKGSLGEVMLDDWPEEVEMCGHTYTLEGVVKLGDEGYESAQYA